MAKITGSPSNMVTAVTSVPVQSAVKLMDARPGRGAVVIGWPGSTIYIGNDSSVTNANGLEVRSTLTIETESEVWAYRTTSGTVNLSTLETFD